ncbi:DNA recombination protein RmuC [Helicobacter macacae]|uniref:DNA recombination protein RmuC n=1 Tax=Helicobacter macacae MIT 99-5501 TaxID=1357400 RepID=V8C7M3_9HELI|nr:DNA recombination protein RmuC [Helicobacter macacae]ETD22746.1 hypothetical protein HMPREF2086_01545 [Helicobacter macacae MIT 99-5501]
MIYVISALLIIVLVACGLCVAKIISLRNANVILKSSDNFYKQQLQGKDDYIYGLKQAHSDELANLKSHHNEMLENQNKNNQAKFDILKTEKEKRISELESEQVAFERKYNQNIEQIRAQYQQDKEKDLAQYEKNLKTIREEIDKRFEMQKNALLEQNKNMLNADSRKVLDEIFTPIKNKVEQYSKQLSENEIKLGTHIDSMFKQTQKLGATADEFAKILRGDKKIRGNFGELQLKSVLESSGLIQGEHYEIQAHFRDDDRGLKPDAIVHLDKERSIIIDAKFSLPNNYSMGNFSESSEFKSIDLLDSTLCKQIAQNLKSRIDDLSKKPYEKFTSKNPRFAQTRIYDFMLLFVPYNNILDLALNAEPTLYQYAFNKQIYLTTPHTLFMALKTINISWTYVESDEKVKEAFSEMGKIYNKFEGLCKDFEKLNRAIKTICTASEDMETKLFSKKDGIELKLNKIKELGAKTKKTISEKSITESKESTKSDMNMIEIDDSGEDTENGS